MDLIPHCCRKEDLQKCSIEERRIRQVMRQEQDNCFESYTDSVF